jgi:hypothetical protein
LAGAGVLVIQVREPRRLFLMRHSKFPRRVRAFLDVRFLELPERARFRSLPHSAAALVDERLESLVGLLDRALSSCVTCL